VCSNRAATRVNALKYWENYYHEKPLFAAILEL
jgi:hypothetical protein